MTRWLPEQLPSSEIYEWHACAHLRMLTCLQFIETLQWNPPNIYRLHLLFEWGAEYLVYCCFWRLVQSLLSTLCWPFADRCRPFTRRFMWVNRKKIWTKHSDRQEKWNALSTFHLLLVLFYVNVRLIDVYWSRGEHNSGQWKTDIRLSAERMASADHAGNTQHQGRDKRNKLNDGGQGQGRKRSTSRDASRTQHDRPPDRQTGKKGEGHVS